MIRFIALRTLSIALTLLAATLVIFGALNLAPGDPAAFMMGVGGDPQALAQLRLELGLDQPVWQRYLDWVAGLLRGDFGVSYTYRVPVSDLILERLRVTFPLALMAMALSIVIAIPAGIYAASRRGTVADMGVSGLAQAGLAIPNFWLAILLVFIFSTTLRWFSAGGFPGWEAGFLPAFQALILPAIALALPQAAVLTRVTRGALIETLTEDYIRTARAKGLSEQRTIRDHALRNAMIPVLTILGLQFTFLIAGGIIIENVFYLPGLGRLVFQAIAQRDLIVVQGVVVALVLAAVVVTLAVDAAYALADPRIRKGAR